MSGPDERNPTRKACEEGGRVRFFARLFPLIHHRDSSKVGNGHEKTVLCCKKSMVGGRGLCSLHDAMVMGSLFPPSLVWGHAVRKRYLLPLSLVSGSHVSAIAALGDCLASSFIWDQGVGDSLCGQHESCRCSVCKAIELLGGGEGLNCISSNKSAQSGPPCHHGHFCACV